MKQLKNLSSEFQSHKSTVAYSNLEELKELVFLELGPFFSNKNNLETVWEYKQIITEYNLFILHKNKPYFKQAFNSFFDIYTKSKSTHTKRALSILVNELAETSRAIQSYAELFHLEQDKNVERLDLFAKNCFRDIGDILEGSIKHFSKLTVLMRNHDSLVDIKDIQKASFGTLVNALLKSTSLESIYQLEEYDITINQLRNIAFHADYKINRQKEIIVCSYGNNQELLLKKDELLDILFKVNELYGAHKLAYEFFAMDNIHEIHNFSIKPDRDITEDSVVVSLYEIAYAYGFEVSAVNLSSDIPEVTITEFKRYDTNVFANTKSIARQMCRILQKEIDLEVIPIFDIKPFSLKPRLMEPS